MIMISDHLLVEGHSEFLVAETVLQPYLERRGIHMRPTVLVTRQVVGGPARRGGVSTWARVESETRRVLKNPTIDVVTTMIDYYGVPADTPGLAERPRDGDPLARVCAVESAIEQRIGDPRFVPHLVLHELEAWVLAAADELGVQTGKPRLAEKLKKIVTDSGGPEKVNDGRDTAPSKRLLALYPDYNKWSDGPGAIRELGIERLRQRCPHADGWLRRLESCRTGQSEVVS